MLKINPSKKALGIMTGGAVLLFLACGLLFFNLNSRLNTLQARVDEKEQKLAGSRKIARQLSDVEQEYQDAQAKLAILESGVSTKAYVPTLLRQIEDLGKSVNLRVVGVRPKAPEVQPAPVSKSADGEKPKEKKKVDPYDKLDIDINVNGKYWDVVRFLDKITCFPKIIAVNNLKINQLAQDKAKGSPTLDVQLNTTAFILKETAPQAKQETTKPVVAAVERT